MRETLAPILPQLPRSHNGPFLIFALCLFVCLSVAVCVSSLVATTPVASVPFTRISRSLALSPFVLFVSKTNLTPHPKNTSTMKGRLPMNDPSTPLLGQDVDAHDPAVEPAPFTRDLVEDRLQPPPYNEQQTLAEHSLELESRIQRTLSENAPRVDRYTLSDSERATLWQNMKQVQADAHQLRQVLSKCAAATLVEVTI